MVRFIDREEETRFLEEKYASGGFELVVIYGRRRVGKTELLRKFLNGKPHLYYLADKMGTARNALRLGREMAGALGEPLIAATEFDELFGWYAKKAGPRPLVVIDEFPYLVEKDDSIPSIFQVLVDGVLKEKNAMLVLCGSSIGMMERTVLGSKSPLYGRKTGHWKVLPLAFEASRSFFPGERMKKCVEFYSVLGGVPHYLEKFSAGKATLDNITTEILSRSGRLYEEIDFLLMEELREPDAYKAILEAMGSGRGKALEIAQAARIPAQDIDKYLKVLIRLGIIEREKPVTEGPRSKRSRYSISDPLFRLWFTFCEPNKSELEIGETARCREIIGKQLPAFVGKAFEPLCREYVNSCFPGRWPRLGRWWGAIRENGKRTEMEIDMVGLNDKSNEALFGECKWSDDVDGPAVLAGLKQKSAFVGWRKNARTETFALFARSFGRRPPGSEAMLFDLDVMAKMK